MNCLENNRIKIDSTWTLFLDRDGVINKKLENDYVKVIEEFNFIDGVPRAISELNKLFNRTVVVTNQQGIGKQIMTHEDLKLVHNYMEKGLTEVGGKLDKIYYCPELAAKNAACRKPNIGMAEQAKSDFPEIDFSKSLMVGDSISDVEMGKNAGMKTVYIKDNLENPAGADLVVKNLPELLDLIKK